MGGPEVDGDAAAGRTLSAAEEEDIMISRASSAACISGLNASTFVTRGVTPRDTEREEGLGRGTGVLVTAAAGSPVAAARKKASRSSVAAISALAASAKVPIVVSESACTSSARGRFPRFTEAPIRVEIAAAREDGSLGAGRHVKSLASEEEEERASVAGGGARVGVAGVAPIALCVAMEEVLVGTPSGGEQERGLADVVDAAAAAVV